MIQTASASGSGSLILTCIIAASAVGSWLAVIVNGYLERKRTDKRENPDLVLLGRRSSAIDKVNDRLALKFTLANVSVLLASVESIGFRVASSHDSPVQELYPEKLSWQTIHPEVKAPNYRALSARSEIPFPIFPSGVTQVGVSFSLDSLTPCASKEAQESALVLYYRIGGNAQKCLVVDWSLHPMSYEN